MGNDREGSAARFTPASTEPNPDTDVRPVCSTDGATYCCEQCRRCLVVGGVRTVEPFFNSSSPKNAKECKPSDETMGRTPSN